MRLSCFNDNYGLLVLMYNKSSSTIRESEDNNKLIKLSTYIAVLGVFVIIIFKIIAWFATDSVTVLASLLDSSLDICVSIMNLMAVHYSLQPADRSHRFGHGKIEDIAVFLQAVFFGASGVWLIVVSIKRFFEPNNNLINSGKFAIAVLVFSTIITLGIVCFQRYVMSRAKSNVIEADSLHYFVDFLSGIAAITGIAVATFWQIPMFDSITAILIALYIVFTAITLLKKAFRNLMDHEMAEEEKQIIIDIIKSHKGILGFHDLKTRYAGMKPFIQFHLELDANMILKHTHQIITELENEILKKIPNAEIIIHQDPHGVEEEISYID